MFLGHKTINLDFSKCQSMIALSTAGKCWNEVLTKGTSKVNEKHIEC